MGKGANHPAFLAVCGWSGSGKTSLIEQLAAELIAHGHKVLVIKRAGRRLEIDAEGKDTSRFYGAGADVFAYDQEQSFLRTHGPAAPVDVVQHVGPGYDVVLVEGHKDTSLPKVWLLRDGEDAPPEGVTGLRAALPPGADRLGELRRILDEMLAGG